MAYIKKEIREKVYSKFDGHCAYCGKEITYKQMQVDHIEPHWHTWSEEDHKRHKVKKGSHSINNFNPSCARCNRWKSTMSLELFREEISLQIERLNRYNNNYRMAKDFGMIKETESPIVFYFEKFENK